MAVSMLPCPVSMNRLDFRPALFQLGKELDSGHVGQVQVKQGDIEPSLVGEGQGIVAGSRGRDLQTLLLEPLAQCVAEIVVIVDDEQIR